MWCDSDSPCCMPCLFPFLFAVSWKPWHCKGTEATLNYAIAHLTCITWRLIYFLRSQAKKWNNFSISNLFPKRKVSSCGSGVQWCNITVLQGTGFNLEKNLKKHLSLLWCREVSFWEVPCLWWSIPHTQLIFCFFHGIQEHTFTPLLCVLTHTGLQRFLPSLILSWTLLNLHSCCFVCHSCISTSGPFPCLKVF